MFLKFYDASGRQLGYTGTNSFSIKRDRAWGIKHFKGTTRVVTQVNGKTVNTHIIITRQA